MIAEGLFSAVRDGLGSLAVVDRTVCKCGRLLSAIRKVYALEGLCSIPTTTIKSLKKCVDRGWTDSCLKAV